VVLLYCECLIERIEGLHELQLLTFGSLAIERRRSCASPATPQGAANLACRRPHEPPCAYTARVYRSCFLGLLFSLVLGRAQALDASLPLSEYGHSAWRVQDGVFGGAPVSIAQTTDGYVWIGTRAGLVRFDGVRFVPFSVAEGEGLRSPRVMALQADRDGSLWIGTGFDLEHWTQGKLVHYPADRGYNSSYILAIRQARDESVWVTRARTSDQLGAFCKVVGLEMQCYGKDQGIPFPNAIDAVEDMEGNFWINDDTSVIHWNPRTLQMLPTGVEQKGVVDNVASLGLDVDGFLLVAMTQFGRGPGLAKLQNGTLTPYASGGIDAHQFAATRVFLDSQHSLWIGTSGQGIYRVTVAGAVGHYQAAGGLSNDTINAFMEDREGNIWVLTNQGVDRFRELPVSTYSSREGLSGDYVTAVLAAHDGSVWVDNFTSLDHLSGGNVTTLRSKSGLPGEIVTALFEDRDHRLWVGIDDGLQIFENGRFKPVLQKDGSRSGYLQSLTQDHAGTIWGISAKPSPHGSLLKISDDVIQEVVGFETVPIAKAQAIAPDASDGIWIPLVNGDIAHWSNGRAKTYELHRPSHTGYVSGLVQTGDGSVMASTLSGVVGIRHGRAQTMDLKNGLPCSIIWTLAATEAQTFLYSECGLLTIANTELQRWWQDPAARLSVSVMNVLDGVQPASASNFPKSSVSPDGRVWFANTSVLQMFNPNLIRPRKPPLLVQLEKVIADRVDYPLQGVLKLPPSIRDLQIDYTAPSFTTPERVQFRYLMSGIDDHWVEAGTRRQAFYHALPPGKYDFRVSASEDGRVWSEHDAAMRVVVPPMFYQTWWFYVLCGFGMIVLLAWLYRLRVRQLAARLQSRLTAQLEERERIARDLHDTLLQSTQGLILLFQGFASRLLPADGMRKEMESALTMADQLLAEARASVGGLRTGPDVSATEALAAAGEALRVAKPVDFRVVAQGTVRPLMPPAADDIYRIGREALINAFQHSNGSVIELEFSFKDDAFQLRVCDDGQGIDPRLLREGAQPDHFGLQIMRERSERIGAKLTFIHRDLRGTEVKLVVPAAVAYQEPAGSK